MAVSARKSIGSVDKQKETVHSHTVSEVGKEQPGTTHRTNNATFHRRYQKLWFIVSSVRRLRDCPSSGGKVEAPGQSSANAFLTATPVDT